MTPTQAFDYIIFGGLFLQAAIACAFHYTFVKGKP